MDTEDQFNGKDAKTKSSKKGKTKPQAARQQKARIDALRKELKANGVSDCDKSLKRRKQKK
jgi:hypothetical protein